MVFDLCQIECQVPAVPILCSTRQPQGNTQWAHRAQLLKTVSHGPIQASELNVEVMNNLATVMAKSNEIKCVMNPSVCGSAYPWCILWLYCSLGSECAPHAWHCVLALQNCLKPLACYCELWNFYCIYKLLRKQNSLVTENNVFKMFHIFPQSFLGE